MTSAIAGADVTIAVVSWNTRELLAAFLDSLAAEVETGRADVVVVDNASQDGSAAMVTERYAWVRLVASSENLGYGRAANLGLRDAATPFVAPANADLELLPGALAALLDAARRAPHAGALAPRLILADGTTQHSLHPFPTLGKLAVFNLGLQRVVPGLGDRLTIEGYWDAERERDADWAHGAFLLVRREAWNAVGGFDEGQWMYAEDLDLAWRLRAAGWPSRYVPSARIRHVAHAATTQAFGADWMARAQANTYSWLLRTQGRAYMRAVALVNIAGALGRAAALTPGALLRPHGPRAAQRTAALAWVRAHRSGLSSVAALRRRA